MLRLIVALPLVVAVPTSLKMEEQFSVIEPKLSLGVANETGILDTYNATLQADSIAQVHKTEDTNSRKVLWKDTIATDHLTVVGNLLLPATGDAGDRGPIHPQLTNEASRRIIRESFDQTGRGPGVIYVQRIVSNPPDEEGAEDGEASDSAPEESTWIDIKSTKSVKDDLVKVFASIDFEKMSSSNDLMVAEGYADVYAKLFQFGSTLSTMLGGNGSPLGLGLGVVSGVIDIASTIIGWVEASQKQPHKVVVNPRKVADATMAELQDAVQGANRMQDYQRTVNTLNGLVDRVNSMQGGLAVWDDSSVDMRQDIDGDGRTEIDAFLQVVEHNIANHCPVIQGELGSSLSSPFAGIHAAYSEFVDVVTSACDNVKADACGKRAERWKKANQLRRLVSGMIKAYQLFATSLLRLAATQSKIARTQTAWNNLNACSAQFQRTYVERFYVACDLPNVLQRSHSYGLALERIKHHCGFDSPGELEARRRESLATGPDGRALTSHQAYYMSLEATKGNEVPTLDGERRQDLYGVDTKMYNGYVPCGSWSRVETLIVGGTCLRRMPKDPTKDWTNYVSGGGSFLAATMNSAMKKCSKVSLIAREDFSGACYDQSLLAASDAVDDEEENKDRYWRPWEDAFLEMTRNDRRRNGVCGAYGPQGWSYIQGLSDPLPKYGMKPLNRSIPPVKYLEPRKPWEWAPRETSHQQWLWNLGNIYGNRLERFEKDINSNRKKGKELMTFERPAGEKAEDQYNDKPGFPLGGVVQCFRCSICPRAWGSSKKAKREYDALADDDRCPKEIPRHSSSLRDRNSAQSVDKEQLDGFMRLMGDSACSQTTQKLVGKWMTASTKPTTTVNRLPPTDTAPIS